MCVRLFFFASKPTLLNAAQFNPVEAKSYSCDLPVMLADGSVQIIKLSVRVSVCGLCACVYVYVSGPVCVY